jgi:cyclic pyranopterin monophosphate synthase
MLYRSRARLSPMDDRNRLTHVDESGAARMVDVGAKSDTHRVATAESFVSMQPDTVRAVRAATVAKGDVLGVARVAAIMGAKRTPELIPLCHPLPISVIEADFEIDDTGVRSIVTARVTGKTGVEMEALTGAAIAALTIIDMVKALEKGVTIEYVRLLSKTGGKSGDWYRQAG